MHELAEHKDKLKSIGVPLVIIGNGSANFGKSFIQDSPFAAEYNDPKSPLKVELYIDTKLAAYKAFELNRGILATISPWNIGKMWKAKAKYSISNGKLEGDAFQQGGTFVVGPGKVMHYAYANTGTGDHAPMADVLQALEEKAL